MSKKRTLLPLLLINLLLFAISSCTTREPVPKDLSKENIIPKPLTLTATGLSFELTAKTDIYLGSADQQLQWVGNYLADMINPPTGLDMKVITSEDKPGKGHIYLNLSNGTDFGEEGYQLEVTPEGISIMANTSAGIFYGVQTLRQLLPPAIEKNITQPGPWLVASGTIKDQPTYGYRGAMLDVARHFFAPDEVKQFIDYLAMFKMNRLHLHLSDDQGWRIEIKSWPNLTAHGGSTEVGGGEGGFYTQDQYAALVKYAQDRFIEIVPEIDMPGHTNAALASYAELNCDGKATELYTGIKVGFSTLCTNKEITYKFIEDVFTELAALTPGAYIHIGGDESHVTPLKDYIPFINRAQEIVEKQGKKVMGWDEIAHAKLLPNTVVQWWAEVENAQNGVKQGAKVLVSPAHKAYLDMQYDSTTQLGLHWAGYIEVDSAYIWDLATIAEGIGKDNIIGIEAPLWSETVTNMAEVEYMIFPRLPGYAEIGWSPTDIRGWEEYKVRLGKQKTRFDIMGINYYPSKLVPWQEEKKEEEEALKN
ncbi:MAG: beta-N-acetylhexosaminidase [Saprospiraceae bacterium]|nr:beta-N-acetylhexosaminidase [Saprospiraceae bacterium]MCB9322295.1 beta-N-acetylhexosaminidase [Lewinellaceae bacterium]